MGEQMSCLNLRGYDDDHRDDSEHKDKYTYNKCMIHPCECRLLLCDEQNQQIKRNHGEGNMESKEPMLTIHWTRGSEARQSSKVADHYFFKMMASKPNLLRCRIRSPRSSLGKSRGGGGSRDRASRQSPPPAGMLQSPIKPYTHTHIHIHIHTHIHTHTHTHTHTNTYVPTRDRPTNIQKSKLNANSRNV